MTSLATSGTGVDLPHLPRGAWTLGLAERGPRHGMVRCSTSRPTADLTPPAGARR